MDFELLRGKFTIEQARMLSPLVLAFVGDAIYEVFVRTIIVERNSDMHVHNMHVEAISYVKAHAQSELMKNITCELNDEELAIYKRGRNAKSSTVPKNADVREYRVATGFEAVIGFLYLTEQNKRLNQILEKVEEIKVNIK